MYNKSASKEDLKYFQTSLCSNEEDAKGLLNIKQAAVKELNLLVPDIVTGQLPEDVFASASIPSYVLSPYSRVWLP